MIKVLVVDDEASTRNGLIDFIPWNQIGVHDIRGAENGPAALLAAGEFRPDIVISDIRMPGMSGIELAYHLRRQLPACRIVFLSGYANKENLKQAIDLRAVKFLEKPIKRSEVTSVVEKIAAQIESERRLLGDKERKDAERLLLTRQKLACDLAEGIHAEKIRNHMKLAEIDTSDYSRFTTFIVKYDCTDAEASANLLAAGDALCQGLSEALGEWGLCINYKSGDEIVNHLFSPTGREPDPNLLLRRAQEASAMALGYPAPVFVGIGKSQSDIFLLADSCRSSRLALSDLFYSGYNAVSSHSAYTYAAEPEPWPNASLPVALRQFDRDGAAMALRSFYLQVRADRPAPQSVRKAYTSLIHTILEFEAEVSARTDGVDSGLQRSIYDSDTLDRIHNLCVCELDAVFSRLESNRESGQVVSKVKRFVNAHYADTDLSIEWIARHLFLSGTYLCHVFKKRAGMTINTYITGVRMEQARELLKNRRTKVTSVAEMVGYSSADHFTKIFRKYNGMGPAEFRDLCASGQAELDKPSTWPGC